MTLNLQKFSTLLLFSVIGIISGMASTGQSANPTTGQVSLNGNVTYSNFTWKFFVDPLNVERFQLDVGFDPTRADPTFLGEKPLGEIVTYLNGFSETQAPNLAGLTGGQIQDITGSFAAGIVGEPAFAPGDVNIFAIEFLDLQPKLDPTTAPFTAFASPGDVVQVFDTDNLSALSFGPGQPDGPVVGFTAFYQATPEPGTFSLAMVGSIALALGLRRRRRIAPRSRMHIP